MNYHNDFLLKTFGIAAILCCGFINNAFAPPGASVGGGSDVPDIGPGIDDDDNTGNVVPYTQPSVQLCPKGQYVYKCGNYRVGFKWLRGMKYISDTTSSSDCPGDGWDSATNKCTVTTGDYYNIPDNSQAKLLQQMRDFFAAESASIISCSTYDESGSCTSYSSPIPPTDYKADRDRILNAVCNPFNSGTAVTCAYCPDSADVPASKVILPSASSTTVSEWYFHTIADCYMKTFTDSTGTFEYIDTSVATGQTAQECYYTNTNPDALSILQGDSILNFVSGFNVVNATVSIQLPSTLTPRANLQILQ